MKNTLLMLIILLAGQHILAQDTLLVSLNKKQLNPGDTLFADCYFKSANTDLSTVTLNVWVENAENGSKWKFRYPIVREGVACELFLSSSLPAGHYALNFLVQPEFFALKGKIKDYNLKKDPINMIMVSKDDNEDIYTVNPDDAGNFTTTKFIFEDSAKFVFSRGVKKSDDLTVNIQNNIDSVFTPIITRTEIITIGNIPVNTNAALTYKFNQDGFWNAVTILPEALMKSRIQKNIERFNKEYATGLFRGEGQIFDGLNDPELSMSKDIFTYLSGKIAGLNVRPLANGAYAVSRNSYGVAVYLDETRVSTDDMPYVNPLDVAMIKVFDNMHSPGRGNLSSIAIYTRRGNDMQLKRKRNNIFEVRGFTPVYTVLR